MGGGGAYSSGALIQSFMVFVIQFKNKLKASFDKNKVDQSVKNGEFNLICDLQIWHYYIRHLIISLQQRLSAWKSVSPQMSNKLRKVTT